MSRDLLDLVRELNTLNDDNLADRVIENSDVQWCLSELQDILEEMPTLTQPNEWVSVEDEIPSDDDDGLEFFCMTNATGKCGGVLPLEWEVATIRGKTVRRWKWLNRISPWAVTHWMKRPAPPDRLPPEGEVDGK